MQIDFQSSRLLRPARPGFIRLTLVLAFFLNLLPTSFWPWFPQQFPRWLNFLLRTKPVFPPVTTYSS